MGRGLSDLQKTMLVKALARRREKGDEDRGYGDDDVQHRVILEAHYGVSVFDDEAAYGSARAALSRAIIRLERRGLLDRWYSKLGKHGFFLTEEGIALASTLSVNKSSSVGLLTDS